MSYRLGVDVGGTFTDLLLLEEGTGRFWRHKTPSTPADSSIGILDGVEAVCAKAEVTPAEVEVFLHGTTVATNAVREGKGARVGLIVTQGYRQIMQIARSYVPGGLAGGLAGWIIRPKPKPLAALIDTLEVAGRMDAQGNELRPIDEAGIRAALTKLRDQGVEAITVSLVNAYLNGAHEARIGELAAEICPDLPISLSHEMLPEMQEYERTLTTVANAAVRPIVGNYVRNLRTKLRGAGMAGKLDQLHFITCGGGGWGDPLEREPVLVAKEVLQALVTKEGARRYGVVIADDAVDAPATEALRTDMRAKRTGPLPLFDRGGEIEALRASCLEETGLPAPRQPVWMHTAIAAE